MLSRIHAWSQKRKWQSELMAALQRAQSHLGMSVDPVRPRVGSLCGWCSSSRLPLI